jgi:hypothetical protein
VPETPFARSVASLRVAELNMRLTYSPNPAVPISQFYVVSSLAQNALVVLKSFANIIGV